MDGKLAEIIECPKSDSTNEDYYEVNDIEIKSIFLILNPIRLFFRPRFKLYEISYLISLSIRIFVFMIWTGIISPVVETGINGMTQVINNFYTTCLITINVVVIDMVII